MKLIPKRFMCESSPVDSGPRITMSSPSSSMTVSVRSHRPVFCDVVDDLRRVCAVSVDGVAQPTHKHQAVSPPERAPLATQPRNERILCVFLHSEGTTCRRPPNVLFMVVVLTASTHGLHESHGANFGDGSRLFTSLFFVISIPESPIMLVELVLSGMT